MSTSWRISKKKTQDKLKDHHLHIHVHLFQIIFLI